MITEGVTPSLHVDYKHTRIKQYHKEGRALRTETTINDTSDFSDRQTADQSARAAGDRLQRQPAPAARPTLSHDPITGTDALHSVTAPSPPPPAPASPGCGWRQQRSHALLAALPLFRLQPDGFANKDLRTLIAELRGLDPATVTAGQITYDLRRLRVRGLITRIPHTHRYRVTDTACTPRCSSPPSTTDSYPPAWPNSPTSSPRHHCARIPHLPQCPR